MSSSSSFVPLRVLVTLLATLTLFSSHVSSRPIPSPKALIRRGPQVVLMSTSGIVTPPLPALVFSRDGVKADRFKMANAAYKVQKIRSLQPPSQDEEQHKRESHDHEHVHIHEHIHGDYSDGYPDWWTSDMIKHHHSQHWAEHHGLIPSNAGHVHEHIHEHIHKRESEILEDRGLIGDLVRPLLAPLNVIPGFVSISNLLFGDGVTDGGLLKTLGGLVLHVEKADAPTSGAVYSFSLMASKNDRTQVYLAPVNQTNTSVSNNGSDSTSSGEDSIAVKITLPLLGANGTAVLMCASYAVAPPSALNLEACHDDTSSSPQQAVKTGSSQLFAYTPSNGSLEPMYATEDDEADPVEAAVTLSTSFKAATPVDGQDISKTSAVTTNTTTTNNITSASPGSNNSSASTDNVPLDGKTRTKVLMQFTPISTMSAPGASSDSDDTKDTIMPMTDKVESTKGTTVANTTMTPSISANNSVAASASDDFPKAEVASPSSSTLIEISLLQPSSNPSLVKSILRRKIDDASEKGEEEGGMNRGDESIDDQSTNPTIVTKEDLLTNKPSTSIDGTTAEGEDDTSQILLSETTIAGTKAETIKDTQVKAPQDANHCPCFAEK